MGPLWQGAEHGKKPGHDGPAFSMFGRFGLVYLVSL